MHARFLSGGQRHNGIAGAYNTARNAPGKAAKICIGPNDALNGEPKALQRITVRQGHGFQMLEQRWPVVPAHSRAALDYVVSFKRADGDALDVGDSKLGSQSDEVVFQLQKEIFAILGQVHLVHSGKHVFDSQNGSNKCVAPRLRKKSFGSVNQNDSQVGCRSACRHVSGVLFVAGRVRNDEFAPRGRKIAVSHVNGDALLAFGTQAIRDQRKIDGACGTVDAAPLHRGQLIFVDGLGIVQ